jgi:hypothetical protein
MRALAREFKARVDLEKGATALWVLSQPIFRYASEADAALFAFVLTTDPESLLMVEARPVAGRPVWHFAFARMSDHSLVAKHRDSVVWEVAANTDNINPAKPCCVRWDVGPPMARTR